MLSLLTFYVDNGKEILKATTPQGEENSGGQMAAHFCMMNGKQMRDFHVKTAD